MKTLIFLIASLFCVNTSLAQGELWGTTTDGPMNNGTIFKTNSDGTGFNMQYFLRVVNVGGRPLQSTLVEVKGKLYGVTSQGGKNDGGVIFEFDPISNTYTHKFEFPDHANSGSLCLAHNGKLYATTPDYYGKIYEFDPKTGQVSDRIAIQNPSRGLVRAANRKLYGTTTRGGAGNRGFLYEYDPLLNTYEKKIDFDQLNDRPRAGEYWLPGEMIEASNGKLYGITLFGGSHDKGVLFEYDILENSLVNKFDFDGANGAGPRGALVEVKRKLFGITRGGGANDKGVIFELDIKNNSFSKVFDFDDVSGHSPSSSLTVGKNGMLYGVTDMGGAINNTGGTLFEFNPNDKTFIKKKDFGGDLDGYAPQNSLMLASNGLFYGMTTYGGSRGAGVIFSFDAVAGAYEKKIDFSYGPDGTNPENLIFFNGKVYGIASGGGVNSYGVLFEFNPETKIYSPKFHFDGEAHGREPSGLILLDNRIFGITSYGGLYNMGTIFEYDPNSNVLEKKVDFDGLDKGARPNGKFTITSSGKLYGMTIAGGVVDRGVIFEYDPMDASFTKKFDFEIGGQGWQPFGGLTEVSDGSLYGMTTFGGALGIGTLFRFDPNTSSYEKKLDLDYNSGHFPFGSLVQATNGKLYGMPNAGGENDEGTLFEYDPILGAFQKKIDFDQETIGAYPTGALIEAPNGKLYGCNTAGPKTKTDQGYGSLEGVLFEFSPETGSYQKKHIFQGFDGGYPGDLTYTENTYKNSQFIFLDPIQPKFYGDASFELPKTSNVGLTINYESSNPKVAKVDGNRVTIIKPGKTVITASQPGTGFTLPAESVSQTLTIEKAPLTISVDNCHKVYGEDDFSFEFVYSGFVSTDSAEMLDKLPTVSTRASKFSAAGTYAVTLSGGHDSNYAFILVPDSLVVNKAPLEIKADDRTKAFGSPMPELSLTYTGFLGTDGPLDLDVAPLVSCIATQFTDAGTYPITLSEGGDNNYILTLTPGNLKIEKMSLQVVANSLERLYGTPNPELTVEYYGFVGDDNLNQIDELPVASTLATQYSDVGSYPITLLEGRDNNYTFKLISGTLRIKKSILNITAADTMRAYGESNPVFQLNFNGLAGSDNVGVIDALPRAYTNATEFSKPGVYEISLSGGTDNNYSFNLIDGALTIVKASQTISFDPIADLVFGSLPTIDLSARASSGLPVTFASIENRVSIASNIATMLSAGRDTLTAAQAGNEFYEAAEAIRQTFCLRPSKPSVTPSFDDPSSPTLTSSASFGNQWFLNDVSLDGYTNALLKIEQPGIYTVQVAADDCLSDLSDPISLVITGDLMMDESISIYPNPTSSLIFITGIVGEEKACYLIDMVGHQIKADIQSQGGLHFIDVQRLATGLYSLQIGNNGSVQNFRFIKQ